MNRLAINTVDDELEPSAEFCRAEGIGLEVTAFALPNNLERETSFLIRHYRESVAGISPLISHGPFLDLVATSPDPAIVEVTRARHEAALAATIEIGTSIYVAHTNYNPMIRNPSYRDNWNTRMLEFWLSLADFAAEHDIVICLENLWEPDPNIQADLISAGDHPHLRASFDNGHALVFSCVPGNAWVEALSDTLAHCHLHDNSGQRDEHKPIGEGKENWAALSMAIREFCADAVLVAESDRLDTNKRSIERLKGLLHCE